VQAGLRTQQGRYSICRLSGRRNSSAGSTSRACASLPAILGPEAQALIRKAIKLALAGDTTALRLCLERIVPQRKSRAVAFDLPRIDRVEDLAGAIGSIFQEVAGGRLRLDEGAALVGMLESKRRALETIEIEKRLRALEAQGHSPGI
jgi:hypothetical protein